MSKAFRVLHLSDLHLARESDDHLFDIFSAWLNLARTEQIDAIVVSGDIVHHPNDRLAMNRARGLLDECEIPWVVVPGNHDVAFPGANEAFRRSFGKYPRVQKVGPIEFLLFDSMVGLPTSERAREVAIADQGWWSHGKVGDEQLAAIDALVDESADCRVAVVHHHLWQLEDEDVPDFLRPLQDESRFISWCRKRKVRAVLFGHAHPHVEPRIVRSIPTFRGGRSTKPPYRARILKFAEGEVAWSTLMLD